MTTPDTHNDTYAATAHRMFFTNWVKKGRPTEGPKLRELADNDGHNTDSVDGLINVLPLSAESALAEDASTSREIARCNHRWWNFAFLTKLSLTLNG